MNWEKICDKTIELAFYFLFFLVPLIMTPFNYELFEFNKMLLVYAGTTIIVSAWLAKMVLQKKIIFKRSLLDIPLLIFLLSQVASTIFSIEPHTSVWGYYSRFHGGLLSTISYLLLYWAYISNNQVKNLKLKVKSSERTFSKNCLYTLMASAFLVAGYGVLEHFGIDAKYWVQDVRNRVFSTLGQPNWLGAWIDILIMLPFAFLLKNKSKKWQKIIFYFSFLIFYFCLLFTGSRSAFIGFLAAFVSFFFFIFLFQKQTLKKNPKTVLLAISSLLLVTLLIGSPFTPKITEINKTKNNPLVSNVPSTAPLHISSSWDIRKVVWQGAINVFKNWPFFGSGVETFAYSYYNFRPRAHNDLSEWDFLYNKAHNEYLNFLACTGLVGFLSYLLLIACTVAVFIKTGKKLTSLLPAALFAGYISILVTNFFGFSVVPVALLFFLLPAFVLANGQGKGALIQRQQNQKLSIQQSFILVTLSLTTAYFLFLVVRLWRADYYFNQGKYLNEADYLAASYIELEKGIKVLTNEALFHSEMAEVAAKISIYYATDQELPPEATKSTTVSTISSQFSQIAIAELTKTMQLNPVHLNFYKSGVKTLLYLAKLDPVYNQKAIDLLLVATQLAPTDAKIFYTLGVLYENVNDLPKAAEAHKKTIELRPHYLEARLHLAKLLMLEDKNSAAKEQLEYILQKIQPGNETAIKLQEAIMLYP